MTDGLEDRLLVVPAVRAAQEALAGRDAWIVGGAVRDAALGRDVVDVDMAVAGDEREAARAVAATGGGHAFQLSAAFGAWRAVAAEDAWRVDVSRLRAPSIERDLELRDFTVNAIAVSLSDSGAGPIDPFGGLDDLAAGLLRVPAPGSFEEDPLRVLRAARLASTLALEVDPETARLAGASAGAIDGTAGERQLAELRLLLSGADPVRGLALLDELGATPVVLPEIEEVKGVEQNPNHHLDVHGHTLEVLRQTLEIERDLERFAGDAAAETAALLAEPLADGFTRGDALRFGALVHDTGKPVTRGERGGYVTFIGHDDEGARIVAGLCRRLRTSRALEAHLVGLTRHHLRLGFLVARRPLSRREVHDYLRATEPVAPDVTLLSAADRLAARGGGPLATEEMIEAHLGLAREMLAASLEWRHEGPPAAPIPGDELAEELGIEPGPELGRLLAEIEAAVYAGEVSGRDQAIEHARAILEG
jgi:putative nucleotidyltransferase with HDIG domain